jgi:O-antigen/teichoic acid export membrane protein
MAFNEVVIRHAGDPGGRKALRRFMLIAGTIMSGVVALIAATPLGEAWYISLERIPEEGMDLARIATWLLIPMPFLTFLISYWQGLLVDVHETRPISEGVAIGLTTIAIVLGIFVGLGTLGGAVAATLALTLSSVLQAIWLGWRWRNIHNRAQSH